MSQVSWQGVYPALTTKFTSDDQLDLPLFHKNLDFQIKCGVDGIILGGTLGEASVLDDLEKETLVRSSVESLQGKVPVIINIAEGSTKIAIQQAHNAENWGAKGLMMLPPMRYKSDHRETVQFFKSIAKETSLPIMIYNNPIDYKIEVTMDMFSELIEEPNIQAIKESTRDVSNVTRLRNAFGDRLKIMCGVDTLAMEELVLGADGWVAGLVCAFPAETVAIFRLIKERKYEEALLIYRWFLPLLELDIHPKLVQNIKLAEKMVGYGSEYVREPRLTLRGTEREKVISIIQKGIDTRPTLS
jgi:1-pyrroline-4-hydroxy-2-carboxylate deaminase